MSTIRELEPNVYLVVYGNINAKQLKEYPLFKYFIVDASKDEQSASIRQISLPFVNDPKLWKW